MKSQSPPSPLVGIVMGSASDAPTLKAATDLLDQFAVPYEIKVCSAHRTPQRAHDFATTAAQRGLKVIIAAAGMSAHLAGVMAALTHLPVLGIPMEGKLAGGLDALLSTVNMPRGIPVATMSLGSHGAANAALFAVAILALSDPTLADKLKAFRKQQSESIPADPPPAEK
jgi:5-(carboxyamino)imidazole ribonucleotide mutase